MPSALAISQRGGFQITVVTAIVIVGFYLCFREIRRLGSELAAVTAKLDDEAFNIEGAEAAPGAGGDGSPAKDKPQEKSAGGAADGGGGAGQMQNLLVSIVAPRSAGAAGEAGGGSGGGGGGGGGGAAGGEGRITEITEP